MTENHQFPSQATSYGPDRLKVLSTAFDGAWQTIAGNFGDAPGEVDGARAALANILLSLPRGEFDTADGIKAAALQMMALGCRDRAQRAWRLDPFNAPDVRSNSGTP